MRVTQPGFKGLGLGLGIKILVRGWDYGKGLRNRIFFLVWGWKSATFQALFYLMKWIEGQHDEDQMAINYYIVSLICSFNTCVYACVNT